MLLQLNNKKELEISGLAAMKFQNGLGHTL
jgi:hypothetical protein